MMTTTTTNNKLRHESSIRLPECDNDNDNDNDDSHIVIAEWSFQCLHTSVIDMLEHILIPNELWHAHSVAMACISWCHTILRTHNTTGLRVLRTQIATSRTTSELWHRATTTIGVLIQFFHILVIRQHHHDHLPEKLIGTTTLTPVRDSIIRLLHRILLLVQEERRHYERTTNDTTTTTTTTTTTIRAGDVHSTKNTATTSNTTTSNEVVNPAVVVAVTSFLTLVSEFKEQYASAAALLLHSASYDPEGTLQTIVGVKVHPDIRKMLQLQMDELVMDQEEVEAMDIDQYN